MHGRFFDNFIKSWKISLVTYNKTGTSQVGAISKAQIKSKGDPLEAKKIREKVAKCREQPKGGTL